MDTPVAMVTGNLQVGGVAVRATCVFPFLHQGHGRQSDVASDQQLVAVPVGIVGETHDPQQADLIAKIVSPLERGLLFHDLQAAAVRLETGILPVVKTTG